MESATIEKNSLGLKALLTPNHLGWLAQMVATVGEDSERIIALQQTMRRIAQTATQMVELFDGELESQPNDVGTKLSSRASLIM